MSEFEQTAVKRRNKLPMIHFLHQLLIESSDNKILLLHTAATIERFRNEDRMRLIKSCICVVFDSVLQTTPIGMRYRINRPPLGLLLKYLRTL